MAKRLTNGLHEKVKIRYITKSTSEVQFNKKILLEMAITQQMKKRGIIKINNGFYIRLSIHLLLN